MLVSWADALRFFGRLFHGGRSIMKRRLYLIALLIFSVVVGWVAFRLVPPPLPELSRQQFLAEVRAGHVSRVTITDKELITGESSTRGPFRTAMKPEETPLLEELRSLGVEIVFERSTLGLI